MKPGASPAATHAADAQPGLARRMQQRGPPLLIALRGRPHGPLLLSRGRATARRGAAAARRLSVPPPALPPQVLKDESQRLSLDQSGYKEKIKGEQLRFGSSSRVRCSSGGNAVSGGAGKPASWRRRRCCSSGTIACAVIARQQRLHQRQQRRDQGRQQQRRLNKAGHSWRCWRRHTNSCPDVPPSPTPENKEKIKLNNQLPYLVANIVEVLDVAPEEEEEEDGATVDLDAQRKGARGRAGARRRWGLRSLGGEEVARGASSRAMGLVRRGGGGRCQHGHRLDVLGCKGVG